MTMENSFGKPVIPENEEQLQAKLHNLNTLDTYDTYEENGTLKLGESASY